MEILFLGTGSGDVELDRFHSSILIKDDGLEFLIDCGDGFTRAFISQNLSFTQNIDKLLITHFHPDHVAGLPSLLVQMKINKREKDLTIYCYKNQIDTLNKLLNTYYIFPNLFPFTINILPFDTGILHLSKNLKLEIVKNTHIKPKLGAIATDKLDFSSFSIKISSLSYNVIYTSDIGSSKDLKLFDSKNTKYFITEVTHISIQELCDVLSTIESNTIVLTHLDTKKLAEIFDNIYLSSKIKENKILTAFEGMCLK